MTQESMQESVAFETTTSLSFEEAVDKKYEVVMQISTDSSNYIIVTFKLIPELVEVGPQIKISHLIWS